MPWSFRACDPEFDSPPCQVFVRRNRFLFLGLGVFVSVIGIADWHCRNSNGELWVWSVINRFSQKRNTAKYIIKHKYNTDATKKECTKCKCSCDILLSLQDVKEFRPESLTLMAPYFMGMDSYYVYCSRSGFLLLHSLECETRWYNTQREW